MNHIARLALVAALAVAVSGCVIAVNHHDDDWFDDDGDWQERQERNREAIDRLELGRSEASVVRQLGEPDMTESFVREGLPFRVLFYRTRLDKEDGRTTRDETTPLVFVDDRLVGWGDSAVEHALP